MEINTFQGQKANKKSTTAWILFREQMLIKHQLGQGVGSPRAVRETCTGDAVLWGRVSIYFNRDNRCSFFLFFSKHYLNWGTGAGISEEVIFELRTNEYVRVEDIKTCYKLL